MAHLKKHLTSILLAGMLMIPLIVMPGCATNNPEKNEQAIETEAEGVGVINEGESPTGAVEDIDEGLVPGI